MSTPNRKAGESLGEPPPPPPPPPPPAPPPPPPRQSVTAGMRPKQRERFYEALIREHNATLYSYAMRLMRHPENAQDLLQDTFAKGWRYLDTFKGGHALAWLKQVMRSVFFDRLKKEKLRHPFQGGAQEYEDYMGEWVEEHDLTEEQLAHLKAHAADPDRWREALTEHVSAEIIEALDTLTPAHREVIFLYHVLDMQYDEIAQEIDAKEGTVMSRLFRARENLQKAIVERGGALAGRLLTLCAKGERRGRRTRGPQK